jgi:hypothetical protein
VSARPSKRNRDGFQRRFEADAHGYLFRAKPTSPPVRVTVEERDRACATFDRHMYVLSISFSLVSIVAIGGIVAVTGAKGEIDHLALWAVVLSMLGLFAVGFMRLWRAPDRAFGHRPPAGATRDRETARRLHFATLSYWQIGAGVAAAVLLVGAKAFDADLAIWERGIWMILGAAMIMVSFVSAWRKWRFERDLR